MVDWDLLIPPVISDFEEVPIDIRRVGGRHKWRVNIDVFRQRKSGPYPQGAATKKK